MGHSAELPHLTASPFHRLQVHLPLPLSRARLPGLLWAPRSGLGLCTRAGHERGERGVRGGRAGRKSQARRRCAGLIPTPCTTNTPSYRFPGIRDASFACGFVRALTPRQTYSTQTTGREGAPRLGARAPLTPRFRPQATPMHMRTRPGPLGGGTSGAEPSRDASAMRSLLEL